MADAVALEAPTEPVAPTSPVGDTTTPPPPEKAAPEPAQAPSAQLSGLLSWYTDRQRDLTDIYGPAIRQATKAVTDAETKAAQVGESVLRPAIEGVTRAASVPVPTLPTMIPEPPVPDRRARPFLANKEGETAISAIVTGLGLLGQLAMSGKAPVAALSALTGSMRGWAEGDAVRADREWKTYLATVDTIRHENGQAIKIWESAMQASGANMLQAEARYKAATAEAGLADKWAAVAQGGMGQLLETLKYEQGIINGVFDRSAKVLEMQVTDAHRQAVERRTAAFQEETLNQRRAEALQRASEAAARLEEARLSREQRAADKAEDREALAGYRAETLDLKRAAAKDVMKSLPASVRVELQADPDVKAILDAGEQPTAAQIATALQRVRAADLTRARAIGNEPKPTPTESMRRLEDMTVAQAYVAEMSRLADSPNVQLDKIVGGVRPWFNQIAQTGKIGPFPVSEDAIAKLTPDERRFLALTQDYADTILRMRSGAAINESEFRRMLQFIPDQSITPATLRARLALQDDLLRSKKGIVNDYLTGGGYRAPDVKPTPVAPTAPASSAPAPAGGGAKVLPGETVVNVRRKKDGLRGQLIFGPGVKVEIPAAYEAIK